MSYCTNASVSKVVKLYEIKTIVSLVWADFSLPGVNKRVRNLIISEPYSFNERAKVFYHFYAEWKPPCFFSWGYGVAINLEQAKFGLNVCCFCKNVFSISLIDNSVGCKCGEIFLI